MSKEISKTQIDRLGDRLKKGNITEDDLRLLDHYRNSFTESYEIVVGAIRQKLGLEPTGRPAKSTTSISEKLRRESIRLTQIQDIAGCRLIVSDIEKQEAVVKSLSEIFEAVRIEDRRQRPSNNYRAVHVIVNSRGRQIEIQVRTTLQQLWAELSEKFSDIEDPAIKYGGGSADTQGLLAAASLVVSLEELGEMKLADKLAQSSSQSSPPDDIKREVDLLHEGLSLRRQALLKMFRDTIDGLERLKGDGDALSN
jgi:putative GTP pyrophosphokinase